MKAIDEIKKADSFWLIYNSTLFLQNNKIKILGKGLELTHEKNSHYLIQDDSLTLIRNGSLIIINENLEMKNIIQIGDSDIIVKLNNNLYEFNERLSRKLYKNGVCDQQGKVLWNKEESVTTIGWDLKLMLYKDIFNDQVFFKRNIDTGQHIWQFEVASLGKYRDQEGEQKGKVKGKIRLWQNILIVPLTNQRMIGIDYNSGVLLWNTFAWERYEIYQNNIVLFDESDYLEINPTNGEVLRKEDLSEYLQKENGIERIPEFKVADGRIYFTDYKKMKIGILDLQSLKLIELITIDHQKDAWQIGDLEINNKKIYIMEYLEDMSKNLHIYEDDN